MSSASYSHTTTLQLNSLLEIESKLKGGFLKLSGVLFEVGTNKNWWEIGATLALLQFLKLWARALV